MEQLASTDSQRSGSVQEKEKQIAEQAEKTGAGEDATAGAQQQLEEQAQPAGGRGRRRG